MNRIRCSLLLAALFPGIAGCRGTSSTVVVESHAPPPEPAVVVYDAPPPEPEVTVVVDDDYEVDYVVYREYYDCSDEEIAFIPYYRRYYAVDDGDLYFLFFVARHTHRPIDVVIHSYYYDCDRDYDRLVLYYHVDPVVFFVDLPRSYSPGGPYERPYRFYRDRHLAGVHFSRDEFRALVTLKVGVEFTGAPPERVVTRVRQQPSSPQRAIAVERDNLGRGRNVRGEKVTVQVERPWKMPERQRQEFRKERQERAQRSDGQFRQRHPQRVDEVQKKDGRQPQHRQPGAREPAKPNPREPAKPNPRDPKKPDPRDPREPRKPKDQE